MDIVNEMKERTFGIEIEMCNLDRSKVSLPSGYSWSKDEEIVNTDGTCNKKFGGEVNTPPLRLCMKDLHGLKSVYESMVNAGGVIKWTTYTHVHIYAGDLTVEQLKNVFLFFYVCYPFVRKYAKISEWDEMVFNLMPVPTEKYYNGILRAETFDDIKELFTNNSKKGFIRHAVNISAYFKTRTIEFRTYHATTDFYEAMNCVFSTYRMFYYAISHALEDFLSIHIYEDFIRATGLKYDTPPELTPLIYQGNPYSAIETFQTRPIAFNSKQASALYEALKQNGHTEVCVANSFLYSYELFLMDKMNVSIYSQDPYCHLLYLLANGKLSLTYNNSLGWLEVFNKKEPSRQLALALYAKGLQKYCMSQSARNDSILDAIKAKAKESIEHTERSSERLLRLLTACEYQRGSLQDAIEAKKVVFFNYGKDKFLKRAYKLIRENSDLEIDIPPIRNEYYRLVESLPEDAWFYFISNSPYLNNLHKVTIFDSSSGERWSAGRYLYCNKPCANSQAKTSYLSHVETVNETVPPDDLVIDNPDALKILKVSSGYLKELQKKYVKKVDSVSSSTYPFVVMYGKYTLGGFGFTLPQHKGYDLFQLTDFCTNNSIPKLSKFILYCIQTKEVQRILSRSMHKMVEKVISCAYTHKPVSMKYRGVYTKVKEHCTSSYLAYEGQLGLFTNHKEVIEKYKALLKNGQRK